MSALLIGAALAIAAFTGASLMLFIAPRLLLTTGLLIGLVLIALAVGVSSVGPATPPARGGSSLIVVYFAAALYAKFWTTQPAAPQQGLGSAIAVLLFLAYPAYASGALLARFPARERAAPFALAGAAIGAALAGVLLIPTLDAGVIFFMMAILLLVAQLWYQSVPLPETDYTRAPMTGKTVLVTGVADAGQLGYTLAEAFVAAGARVVCVDRSGKAEALARQLGDERVAIGLHADLVDDAAVTALFETIRGRLGRLDAVINAAGGLRVIKPIGDTDHDEWRAEIERNSDTTFLVSRAALPLLRESKGCIVNITSPAGLRARRNLGAYSASKAAVVALTRTLALEEKSNSVRANAVAPGMIDTEQNRQSVTNDDQVKWVTRKQIADAVVFLCSPAASGITGETIQVLGEGAE